MTDTPLVTIAMTCFNARATIGRALESAFAQDYRSLEILVVDDCSTDGSGEMVARLIEAGGRARLIRHTVNTGPAGARNTLLAKANGEFVAFFDDDDEARPQRISEQVRVLEAYEVSSGAKLVACYASGERLYRSGYVKPLVAIGSQPIVPYGAGVADYLLFYRRIAGWFYGSGIPAAALLARRSTFAAVGGFDTKLRRVEDADFAIRLSLAGGHFVGTQKTLFVQHSTSGGDKSPEANRDAEVAIARKHAAYLTSRSRAYYAAQWPVLRYWHLKRRYGRMLLVFVGIFVHNPISATRHILSTGPARLAHERRIRKGDRT